MTHERNIDDLETVPDSDAWQCLDQRLARQTPGDPDAVWEKIRHALGGAVVAPAASPVSEPEILDDSETAAASDDSDRFDPDAFNGSASWAS